MFCRTGYRVSERGLQEKDYLAETPGPPKSPTSYQAFLKKDYVHCVPDWVMAVVLQSDEARPADHRLSMMLAFF